MSYSNPQKLTADFLGTAILVATVVGSGVMAVALCAWLLKPKQDAHSD